ncbi:MAG: hypothetical protein UFM30_05765 [Bacteroidales bacterium]|nr:hypothetical protein [Bacteroidales bacterium]
MIECSQDKKAGITQVVSKISARTAVIFREKNVKSGRIVRRPSDM